MAETMKKTAYGDDWTAQRTGSKHKKTAPAPLPASRTAGKPKRSAPASSASRKPDMSHPVSRVEKPQIVIGSVPKEKAAVQKKPGLLTKVLKEDRQSVRTVREKRRNPFPVSLVLCTMLCFSLFMFMVLDYVKINEFSVRLSQVEAGIEQAQKTEQELALELERRNDLTKIARIAEEDLGMVKLDEIAKIHLNSLSEDKIELTEAAKEQPEESSVFSGLMSAVGRIFGNMSEYSE